MIDTQNPCCDHSRRDFLATAGAGALVTGIAGAMPARAATPPPGAGQPAAVLKPFDMADVTLADGPFLHAQRMTEAYLMRLQPDRLLHNFRVNAGLKPKAPPMAGGNRRRPGTRSTATATRSAIICQPVRSPTDPLGKRATSSGSTISPASLPRASRRRGRGWSAPSPRARRWSRRICAATQSPAFPGTRSTRSMLACAMPYCSPTAHRRARCWCGWRTGAWWRPSRCPTPSSRRC